MPVAMTGLVKDELSRVTVLKPCCRKAEGVRAAALRGGLHLASGRIVVEAELTPAWPHGGCARTSRRCSAIPLT